MADCSDCGMGSLGALSVKVSFVLISVTDISAGEGVTIIHQIFTNFLSKVCGQAPVSSPGGQCCVAVNLDNSENNFQDGGVSHSFIGVLIMAQCHLPMGSMLPIGLHR